MHRDHHFRMLSTISDHKSAINPLEICSVSQWKHHFSGDFGPSFHQGAGGGCLAHEPAMSALHARGKEVPWGKMAREFSGDFLPTGWFIVFFSPWCMLFFWPWFETQWNLTILCLSYKLVICSWLIFDDMCFFMTFKLLTNGRSYTCHPIFSALV